nr:hypothetical protein [Mesorhizobium sp.]
MTPCSFSVAEPGATSAHCSRNLEEFVMEPMGGDYVSYGLFFACAGFVALVSLGGLTAF